VADILINGVFWDAAMPRHFSKEDTKTEGFSIKLIGDISCDIEGSVPITLHDTHAENPVFGWNSANQCECDPYLENSIDVLAVSNLPSELPANSSEGFGLDLINYVLPELLKPKSEMIKNATICEKGYLTEKFKYLSDYIS
jgi:alanine dehydrogenase